MRNDAFGGLKALTAEYGDVIGIHWPFSTHLISHPDHVKRVFKENAKNYNNHWHEVDELKPLIGDGIFLAKGEAWTKQRRAVSREFHLDTVLNFVDPINQQVARWIDEWKKEPSGSIKDIPEEMMSLTLRIAGDFLFGAILEDSGTIPQSIEVNSKLAADRIRALIKLPRSCPLPSHRKANRLIREMDTIIYSVIRDYQEKRPERINVLSRLIAASEKEGQDALSNKQLRDEMVTLLVAGHETSAGALFWTLYELARNPDVQEKLHSEIRDTIGLSSSPTGLDLRKLNYPRMVIEETLRLYPSFANISRHVAEDDDVGGYFIPGNSLINVCPYLTHRHKDFWTDPELFKPERFLAEKQKDRHPYAYTPFGKGPRACIGENFAMVETQLILIPLIQTFEFGCMSSEPILPKARISMVPSSPMKLSITRRSS